MVITLRDELLMRAKLGEITPDEAETEALFAECGPLEVRSYPIDIDSEMALADLDPETEPAWTLLMALVWIITRDPIAVRAVWSKARGTFTHWADLPLVEADGTISEKKTGWELRPLPPPTVSDAEAVCEVDEDELLVEFLFPPIIVPGIRAREELWDKLRSGVLHAEGNPHGTSERIPVSASDWKTLDWLDDPSAPADTVGSRTDNVSKYDNVSLSGQKVREIWKPLENLNCQEYERENWSVDHAALWIAYRDPTLLRFAGLTNPRAKRQHSSAECLDPKPWSTLGQALMRDKLRAIRNGEQIPPETWFSKRIPRKQSEKNRIYVPRSAVLREWPEREGNLFKAAGAQGIVRQSQPAGKRGPRPSVSPRVLAAMEADMAQGIDIENMKEVVMEEKYGASRDTCRKVLKKLLNGSVEK